MSQPARITSLLSKEPQPDEIPVADAFFDQSCDGINEGFVIKFDPDLTILTATHIGGGGADEVKAIADDKNDEIYIAGRAGESGYDKTKFPMQTSGFGSGYNPNTETIDKAFVLKFDNSLKTLLASTFLAGKQSVDSW